MRILITGIHGFVGGNLVEALSPDHTLYGLDIVSPVKNGVEKTFSWDDLDKGLVPEVDAIIHLAGKAHDIRRKAVAESYFAVNTGLTQKIYDYFLSHGIGKFIFFSSSKAAADRVDGVLTEDVTPAPVGPYGESKIKAEQYILGHMKDSTYILRPCMIHGPGNKGNLNLLYSLVSKGIPWPLGAFGNLRTFTSIGNVCFIVKGLLTGDVPGGIYNIGDDNPVSTNDLVGIISDALGKKCRIWHLPRWMMNSAASVGSFLHLPLDRDRMQKLTENYVSSNARIKKALGVDFLPVEAREGLYFTIKSFCK